MQALGPAPPEGAPVLIRAREIPQGKGVRTDMAPGTPQQGAWAQVWAWGPGSPLTVH